MFKDANRSTCRKDPDQTDQSDLGLLCLIRSINYTKTLMVSVNGHVYSGFSTCIFLLLSSRSNNEDNCSKLKICFFVQIIYKF